MNKIILCVAALAAEIMALVSLAPVAHAETYITNGLIDKDTVWSQENSPYIIADYVNIVDGATLTVSDGVVVKPDPSQPDLYPGITADHGYLDMEGTNTSHISIQGLSGIFVNHATATIAYADLNATGLFIENRSSVVVATSTITNADEALNIKESRVLITGSRIKDNARGITIRPPGDPFLVRLKSETGGLGNVLDPSAADSILSITSSSISGNNSYALNNMSEEVVLAKDNWWGSADGPLQYVPGVSNTNSISGLVDYTPWLSVEPPIDLETRDTVCCSSILFLPGLEATRLYRDEPSAIGIGMTTNTLWEPNRNDDVRKLLLNPDGSSVDQSIYSGEPIGSAFGIQGVYGKFMEFMDGLVENGTVREWKSFGYDWRKPVAEVVAGTEKKATTTESLLTVVDELASRSKTGKVSLIAHSNGGLVAKYLIKTLSDLGKSGLVDGVISVAVPYLGTPQAILGLLHGDDQAIADGLVLKSSVARRLGENMPSAYSLLPSREYFSKVFTPTIAFASTTVVGINDGSYPQTIYSSKGQADFLTDSNNARTAPDPEDTARPIKASSILMAAADALHAVIDPFAWPATIAKWAIVGWNQRTALGIGYFDKRECIASMLGINCKNVLGHEAPKSFMGDGTVVAQSAAYDDGQVLSVDLKNISASENRDTNHSNILESSTTQSLIRDIIKGSSTPNTPCGQIGSVAGVVCGEPDYSQEPANIVVSTHSPIGPHVYDTEGRHTGEIALPPGLDIEEGLFTNSESQIPGSLYEPLGDGEDTYIYLPDDGKKYTVVLEGSGVGTFTLYVDRVRGANKLNHVEYANLPVTPLTIASTTIEIPPIVDGVSINDAPFTSSVKPLSIDVDGNGKTDIQAKPNEPPDLIAHLDLLKDTITSLLGNDSRAKNIIKRVDKIEGLIKKGKLKKSERIASRLEKRIEKFGHKKLKGLSQSDREQIVSQIELFITQFE